MAQQTTTEAEAWTEFRAWMAWAHPDGAKVVDRAQAAGCRLDECFLVEIEGPSNVLGGFPLAMFGERGGRYLVVQPDGVSECRPVERGSTEVKL